MKRREFVVLLGGAATALACRSLTTWAQPPARTWRIGFIVGGEASPTQSPYSGFVQGMRELGYTEGKDFVIEWRSARGNYERFPGVARELIEQNVDVIVLATSAALRPVQQITRTVPIVMSYSTDPVATGFIDSLLHPGGSTTGLVGSSDDISPKQIELMLGAMPKLCRIGALGNPDNPNYSVILRSTEAAARNVGIAIFAAEARSQEELDLAFAKLVRLQVQAVKIFPDGLFFMQRSRIANLARMHRMPSVSTQRECAEAGGLMSYGENLSDFFRRAAAFVDKILRGAKPGELPVERSTKFELALNLRTAHLFGIEMPPNLVALADEVIE
jgi:putative tryptophan/tyrosine transport system substrate-binding protein